MRRRVVIYSAGLAAAVPLYYYLSDSEASIYKYALRAGRFVTEKDHELAHRLSVFAAKYHLVPRDKVGNDRRLESKVWGLSFPNPIGLAAGFDKNAECIPAAYTLGFGFTEVGTVTPLPQPGNPSPRVFRLAKDEAIINRFGFNSEGAEVVARNLARFREAQATMPPESRGVVGVNLGKNKSSENAIEDYLVGVRKLAQFADYLVINVSSPNTAGLRDLQAKEPLKALLTAVTKELASVTSDSLYVSKSSSRSPKIRPPLLIKVSPDMTDKELESVAAVCLAVPVDGIVISNTTVGERDKLKETFLASEPGGLSGKPLLSRSNAALASMYRHTKGKIPIIGVGGVASAEDAYEKIKLGASLVQVYTALVYEGPALPATMKRELVELLKVDGFVSVQEAVGAAHRSKEFMMMML